MALEQIFSCQKTLDQLQKEPLSKQMDGFCLWLIDRSYSHATIPGYLMSASHFNTYLSKLSNAEQTVVTAENIEGFFQDYTQRCHNRGPNYLRRAHCAINRFIEYLREEKIFVEASLPSPIYQPLLDAYLTWMQEERQATDSTLAQRKYSLSGFLQQLGTQATVDGLAQLTGNQVEQLFLTHAQGMKQGMRHLLQTTIRTFLRFCLIRGYICQPLDQAVPPLRTYRLSTVPCGLSEEQAQQVLASVDCSSAIGLRNYAILLMLYTYGVRSGQVRGLCMNDIHWSDNRILFRAMKKGKDTWLPLTAAVGKAVLEYLQQVRPVCVHQQVFLTTRAPYCPLGSSIVSEIVAQQMRKTGIPRQGAHTFRHGFAIRMLYQGQSLKAIADVLGHRQLSTTFIYTKVDFNHLEEVALAWPREESTC